MPYTASKSQIVTSTVVSIGSGGTGETFTNIAEVIDAQFAGFKQSTADVTSFNSGGVKQKLNTLLDYGTLKVTANRISSDPGQVAVQAAVIAGGNHDFKIVLPMAPGQTTTGDSMVITGIVVDFMPGSFSLTKQPTIEFTIDINNIVTTEGA
jgi:hypothetical protein